MWPRNSFFRKVRTPSWLRSFTVRALLYALAVLLWWPSGASAQTASLTPGEGAANPLAALNQEVKQVLADAQVPFTENQERAIALMMEERRRASEDLFGDLLDFSGGPTEGPTKTVSDRRSTGCGASFSRTSPDISPRRRPPRGRHIWPRAGSADAPPRQRQTASADPVRPDQQQRLHRRKQRLRRRGRQHRRHSARRRWGLARQHRSSCSRTMG